MILMLLLFMTNHVVGILNCFQQSCFILSETFKTFLLLNDTPILGHLFLTIPFPLGKRIWSISDLILIPFIIPEHFYCSSNLFQPIDSLKRKQVNSCSNLHFIICNLCNFLKSSPNYFRIIFSEDFYCQHNDLKYLMVEYLTWFYYVLDLAVLLLVKLVWDGDMFSLRFSYSL